MLSMAVQVTGLTPLSQEMVKLFLSKSVVLKRPYLDMAS